MAEGAVIDIARERDQALYRHQVIATELRAHEQTVRHSVGAARRFAEERKEKGRGR